MFDEAYYAEANIAAAEILKEREWKKLYEKDWTIPPTGFVEILMIERYSRVIKYWSIMYGTHGT